MGINYQYSLNGDYTVALTGADAMAYMTSNGPLVDTRPITAIKDDLTGYFQPSVPKGYGLTFTTKEQSMSDLRKTLKWVQAGADPAHVNAVGAKDLYALQGYAGEASPDLVELSKSEKIGDEWVETWGPKLTVLGEYELRRLDILAGDA